ncbi:hypothetical protein O3G_MSEX012815 [Manduca sexta]|uniref:Uncharacterized protein n=1 Tax=Manduca sexta TaxID=7130 RepID=A0A922CYB9_MANSE|nr:hypothetical protein O3G_MSEX012815 [Manduca sexta]
MLVPFRIHHLALKIYILITFNIITITSITMWKIEPMHWYENPNADDKDLCADGVVCINLDLKTTKLRNDSKDNENHTVVATGVLISKFQVLTSFNAFRKLTRDKNKMRSIAVGALKERVYNKSNIFYNVSYHHIVCGRQVIPMRDSDIKTDNWHGKDHLHSPLHDLMVLRLERNYTLRNKDKDLYVRVETGQDTARMKSGPLLTVLAKTNEVLGRDIKIVSIGHETDKHIYKNFQLLRHDYDSEDNVVVDCDQWIPRQWGHFICLRNVNDFEAIASGAALFYNSTLYGIGSFALRKGKKGILVFTDVRPYYGLINETCSTKDQI